MTRTGHAPSDVEPVGELDPSESAQERGELDAAWAFVRALAGGEPRSALDGPSLRSDPTAHRGWNASDTLSPEVRTLLDVYVPLVAPSVRVLGHLGQSIDGFIAAADGGARGLSSTENIVHLHRLRALFDAVVVGARTANDDDPELTTRLAPGPNPARVVLDSELRCDPALRLFHDGLAPTFLVCAAGAPERSYSAATRVVRLRAERVTIREAVLALNAEGLERFFVEGGGVTVSRCLAEGSLDRLHVAVAPLLLGAGRPGVQLSGAGSIREAWRAPCAHFSMGRDVLFDFDLA